VLLRAAACHAVLRRRYQLFFRDTPLRRLIALTTVFGALIGSTGIILYTHYNRQLGIPDKV
jgi:hypothetical protein